MKRIAAYALLTSVFAFLASGAVIAAYLDNPGAGAKTMWLIVPVTLLFMVAVAIDVVYAIPCLLLRQRYFLYCLLIVGVAYAASTVALVSDSLFRLAAGFPQRVGSFSNPWVWVSVFSDSMLLLLILLGLGVRGLYLNWRAEAEAEKALSDRLDDYMAVVRTRLAPDRIMAELAGIANALRSSPATVAPLIRSLSAYLREQLYELPAPPPAESAGHESESLFARFLCDSRYRLWRWLTFQLILVAIAFGSFFVSPDKPDFAGRLWGFLTLLAFLDLLAVVNITWLFPRFRRHRSLLRHGIEAALLVLALLVPVIIGQTLSYDANPYDKQLPAEVVILSTAGTVVTLFLFVGATSAIMFCRDWVGQTRRMTLLRAETVRQEYAFLKKQINPHFLFNVLNNIGILAADEPFEASAMLAELRRLIGYQLRHASDSETTVVSEIAFLRTYLNLARTRIDGLEYQIQTDGEVGQISVPTLLFATFVENAVKHSAPSVGRRQISVRFSETRCGLVFICENTIGPVENCRSDKAGGLGLANTLRRLELLYGSEFSYQSRASASVYSVVLRIPCLRT